MSKSASVRIVYLCLCSLVGLFAATALAASTPWLLAWCSAVAGIGLVLLAAFFADQVRDS